MVHKRSLDFPFVFGNGPITKRHKGRSVGEKGCSAVCSAVRQPSGASGRTVRAFVYRESYSGRIEAMYHNDLTRFGSHTFTLIPKTGFKGVYFQDEITRVQQVFTREPQLTRVSSREMFLPQAKVENALRNLDHFTIQQAEDSGWFLSRGFQFTSRTIASLISATTSNYNTNIRVMATCLTCRTVVQGADPLPSDISEVENVLDAKWSCVIDGLNMQIRIREVPQSNSQAILDFNSATVSSLNGMRKEELLSLLSAVDHRQSVAQGKQQLIQNITELQARIANGSVQLDEILPEQASATKSQQRDTEALEKELYNASLTAWFMKPLATTAGMREGSVNELQVLKALPKFFERHILKPLSSSDMHMEGHHKVQYIRTVGLLGSLKAPLLAGSPDAIIAISNPDDDVYVAAVERKTMTALGTIRKAKDTQEKHGHLSAIRGIGENTAATDLFHDLVPNTSYRLQCLHHAAVVGKRQVLLVVSKGSNMGLGHIMYAALLEFSTRMVACYDYTISSIRLFTFMWIGKASENIPAAYDELLHKTHATVLDSYASFYSFSNAYKSLANHSGALPPARMIRPSALVFWNSLKGGGGRI